MNPGFAGARVDQRNPPAARRRRGWLLLLVAVTTLSVQMIPSSAGASPETLRLAFSNIFMGPFDMILSPVVGPMTLANNLQDIEDTTAVKVVYAVPGLFWLIGLDFAGGFIRMATGFLELPAGILLFPFERDIDSLFNPVEDAPALIDWENPLVQVENPWVYYNPLVAPFAIRIKAGINYTRAEY